MDIYSIRTGRLFAIPMKEGLLPEISNIALEPLMAKLTDPILKAEMSIENKENNIFED